MLSQTRPALVLLAAMTLLTGLAYPLAMTGIGQVLFPVKVNGSLVTRDGTVVGSALVGQSFVRPDYFHGRPSAVGYDAAGSGGTNLGPTSRQLIDDVSSRVRALAAEAGSYSVPVDLVTSSGSGLDPHISPESAYMQVARVAGARNLPVAELRRMVGAQVEEPLLGLFGKPVVNVLKLNLALDALSPASRIGMDPENGASAQ